MALLGTIPADQEMNGGGGGPHADTHAIAGSDVLTPAAIGAAVQGDIDAGITAHVALSDPHSQYQRESEKGAANGYASLGADGIVPAAQLPPGGGGFAWHAIVKQAADLVHATTTLTNTDLIFNFAANRIYLIDLFLMCTSAALTTGYRFAFDVSVAVTTVGLHVVHQLGSGTVSGLQSVADDTVAQASSGVPTAGAVTILLGKGILISAGSAGTCRLRFGCEVAASATFKARSTLRVHDALAA